MALECKVVSFTIDTTVPAGNSFVVAHGASFTPKAAIFFTTGITGTPNVSDSATALLSIGFSDGTNNRANAAFVQGGSVASRTIRGHRDTDCILLLADNSGLAAVDGRAKASFDATNITITVNDQFTVAAKVIAILYGGTDITDVVIGDVALATATGNQDVTTGLTINDNEGIVFFASGNRPTANTQTNTGTLMFGAMASSAEQAVWSMRSANNVGLADCDHYCRAGECVAIQGTTVEQRAVGSWIANGFRLNILETVSGGILVSYMVLKGGRWACKNATTVADTTTTITVTTGWQPSGGVVVSAAKAENAQDTQAVDGSLSVGFFTSTTERMAQGYFDQDSADVMSVGRAFYTNEVYTSVDGSGSILGLMDVDAILSNGVRFIMDDADPVQRFFFTVLSGSGVVANQNVSGSITPSGSIENLLGFYNSGSISPSGSVTNQVVVSPINATGSITPIGDLAELGIGVDRMNGTLSPSGSVLLQIIGQSIDLIGSIDPFGDVSFLPILSPSGSITPIGTLRMPSAFSGSIGSILPSGSVSNNVNVTKPSNIGSIVRRRRR